MHQSDTGLCLKGPGTHRKPREAGQCLEIFRGEIPVIREDEREPLGERNLTNKSPALL